MIIVIRSCGKHNEKKVLRAYTLEGDDDFLYSNHSEYIHETITGITPSKKDTCESISEDFK